jgi:hypothetical protein
MAGALAPRVIREAEYWPGFGRQADLNVRFAARDEAIATDTDVSTTCAVACRQRWMASSPSRRRSSTADTARRFALTYAAVVAFATCST